ncbi:MAG: hypothetical protein EBZ67_07890 [Chitinophagia bacterium]|nr:hypothetical protein [Chitinophagia bacterium]
MIGISVARRQYPTIPRFEGHPQLPFLDAVQEAADSTRIKNKAVSNRFMYAMLDVMKLAFFGLIIQ